MVGYTGANRSPNGEPNGAGVYDAKYVRWRNPRTVFQANDNEINFLGNKPEHVYELYASKRWRPVLPQSAANFPFDTLKANPTEPWSMLESGSLIVYIYNAVTTSSTWIMC